MADNVIDSDADTLGGTPVFSGTRVPIRILIEYLETGWTTSSTTFPRSRGARRLPYSRRPRRR